MNTSELLKKIRDSYYPAPAHFTGEDSFNIGFLMGTIERLKKALEFYSNPENYSVYSAENYAKGDYTLSQEHRRIVDDEGIKARQTLREVFGDEK